MGKWLKFTKRTLLLTCILLVIESLILIARWHTLPDEKKAELCFDLADISRGSKWSCDLFDLAITYNPDLTDAYQENAVTFFKRGYFPEGFSLLDKAVDINPSGYLGYKGWIKLRKLRAFRDALKDFNELDSLSPNSVDYPWGEDIDFLRGECYLGIREFDSAISCFERKVYRDSLSSYFDPYAHTYTGIALKEKGDIQGAIDEFKNVVGSYSNSPEAWYYMAVIMDNDMESCSFMQNAFDSRHYLRSDIYNEFLYELYEGDLKKKLNEYCP